MSVQDRSKAAVTRVAVGWVPVWRAKGANPHSTPGSINPGLPDPAIRGRPASRCVRRRTERTALPANRPGSQPRLPGRLDDERGGAGDAWLPRAPV